jgi:chloramphenicol O-acetyltransferase type A
MPEYLDVTTWSRREVFEFFRDFDKPYFNICTQLDVTNLVALRGRPNFSAFLAYHYFALRMANAVEPFRYRLSNGKVLVHDMIHGAITVLLRNETFTFAYFDYDEDFGKFVNAANRAISEAHSDGAFKSRDTHDAVIHFTTLPWISFTSFSHARNWGREDSVPKIAFGRFTKENDRVLLPMSVEVHHALVDGLHVGRFVNKMEEAMIEPATYLAS